MGKYVNARQITRNIKASGYTLRIQNDVDVSSANLPRKHKPDYVLLVVVAILITIGLMVIYSISPALSLANNVSNNFYLYRQMIAVALGTVAFIVASQVPLSWWFKYYKLLLIVAVLATLAALALPVNPQYPAHRWVRLGSLSFESVELVQFAVLIWMAIFLADRIRNGLIRNNKKTLYPILGILVLIGGVIAGLQSDLGSTFVMVVMMAVMAFVAGIPMKKLVIIITIIGAVGLLAISTTPYRMQRILTFLHPTANCQSSGYQECQAIISVGSGGMFGLGLGRSVQAYGYLPESANDSIFAIYSEKFGFIGSAILLVLFGVFFYRLKNIATRAPNDFTRLVVVAILVWLSVQAFVNIGAMIGLLPLKGITLPFISYGGTTIVFLMVAMGVVFQISRYTTHTVPTNEQIKGRSHENNLDRRRLRGAYNTSVGNRT